MTQKIRAIAIFGATSAMAQEAAKIWAAKGCQLFLCAKDEQKLLAMKDDLQVRGAEVHHLCADLNDLPQLESIYSRILEALPHLDAVLLAHGVLGDPARTHREWSAAEAVLRTNFLSVAALATPFANWFEAKKDGCIAVISSVAGDRGRQSNYLYGASKAGLDAFLSGLRNRLYHSNVKVVTIKPGFVSTPMTAHLKQGLLFASPQKVGKGIVKAMAKGSSIVYLPWFWRWIMLVFRILPEFLFKRLRT